MTDSSNNSSSSETSFDYALDERQRNMLDAMGIKLWLPEHQAAPVQQAAIAAPQNTVSIENLEQKQPIAVIEYARLAIKNIAPAPALPASTAVASIALSPRPEGIAQMDWPALQRAVKSCQACALCQSRKNTVFGVGQPPTNETSAPQVDWLIVGEAPGENEDAQGEPFVGQSGKLLDNMLAAMKIGKEGKPLSRQEGVYIANVIKCRPPDNRNPSAQEIATCEPYLARQIELLRPKMILAMGKFAISTVTGSNEPVGKLRGKVHKLHHPNFQAPVIVTYHPAYLLRNLPEKAKAWADLLLAMQTYRELPSSEAQPD